MNKETIMLIGLFFIITYTFLQLAKFYAKKEKERSQESPPQQDEFQLRDVPLSEPQQRFVWRLCQEYNIPISLIYGIMDFKTNFGYLKHQTMIGIMGLPYLAIPAYLNYDPELFMLYDLDTADPTDFYTNVTLGINMLRMWSEPTPDMYADEAHFKSWTALLRIIYGDMVTDKILKICRERNFYRKEEEERKIV